MTTPKDRNIPPETLGSLLSVLASLVWLGVAAIMAKVFGDLMAGQPVYPLRTGVWVIVLWGLRAALDMIHTEGMEAIWTRHERLAGAVWAACEAWAQAGPLTLNVAAPQHRSHAVTALRMGAPHGTNLRRYTEHQAGVTLGIGLGMSEPDDPMGDGFFRIGHMGHVNAHMVLGTLASMQAGFDALELPYGAGALDAAAKALSGA